LIVFLYGFPDIYSILSKQQFAASQVVSYKFDQGKNVHSNSPLVSIKLLMV